MKNLWCVLAVSLVFSGVLVGTDFLCAQDGNTRKNAPVVEPVTQNMTQNVTKTPAKTPAELKKERVKKKKELKKVTLEKKEKEKDKREKGKPKNQPLNFKSDFNGRALTGNLEAAFKTHPEFKALVEEEVTLERQSRALVKKYRAETDSEKKKVLEAELRTLVERHFTVRQERRLFELKLFEERIATLREEIKERNEKKDRIVEKRMIDLTGCEEDLRF